MKRVAMLLSAALCLLAATALADLNDGKPCFTYINPPGNGVRYVCTSTSSQTVERGETMPAARAWRTRITARREGQGVIYDRTFDSLAEPLGDLFVRGAFEDARRLVAAPGFAPSDPTLLSSSTVPVRALPMAPGSSTVTTSTISLSSVEASRTFCVGDLGTVTQEPPPLPPGPCFAGAAAVTLRPLDASGPSTLADRLDDTNTHTRTDRYTALVLTGDLTTSHYEIVATPGLPCSKVPATGVGPYAYACASTSHHDASNDSVIAFEGDAWSTRVTARLADGTVVYDATVASTLSPDADETVRRTLVEARDAAARAVSADAAVVGPTQTFSAQELVSNRFVPAAVRVTSVVSTFGGVGSSFPRTYCLGDVGPLAHAPAAPVFAPCPSTARPLTLQVYGGFGGHFTGADNIVLTHTHVQRDLHAGITVTGTLTTLQYEYVAEAAPSTLVVPILLSPTGGSAFTSELTLTNLVPVDTRVTFSYTPAFGGTPGTVTDALPGATQKILPDAVAYLKGLGLNDPGAGGVLRMTFEGAAAPDVYASVRTTAAVPEGRVGLAYAALSPSKLFSSPVVLPGLRQNALDRSNVAVLNAGAQADGDITLRLTVASGDPANPQSKALPDITLSPGGFSQISSILISNGLSLATGTVKVERVAGSALFYAYAVVNDQATADGSFIEPVAANSASPIPMTTLPVLLESSSYSTELALTNLSASPRTLNFTWVAPALTGGKATFSIALLPNEQQILPGFVQLLRDRGAVTDARGPSFAGSLFVSDVTGDLRGVAISARILSSLGSGRAGVALPSTPSGSESTAPVWFCGLRQNDTTRSNVALVNVGSVDSSSSDFRIDLYDGANGTKVASPVATVPAKGFAQIDRILAAYAPGTPQGCALVTRTSGNNPFIAYAVLNDGAQPGQRSGDGAFVASVLLSP